MTNQPMLEFKLSNTNPVADGEAVVYFGDDLKLNMLSLRLSNKSRKDIRLAGGKPVIEKDPPDSTSPSSLYLSSGGKILFADSADTMANLNNLADDCSASYFKGGEPADPTNLGISPKKECDNPKDCVLKAGDSIDFSIRRYALGSNPGYA